MLTSSQPDREEFLVTDQQDTTLVSHKSAIPFNFPLLFPFRLGSASSLPKPHLPLLSYRENTGYRRIAIHRSEVSDNPSLISADGLLSFLSRLIPFLGRHRSASLHSSQQSHQWLSSFVTRRQSRL
jgi:hypothetical protein